MLKTKIVQTKKEKSLKALLLQGQEKYVYACKI